MLRTPYLILPSPLSPRGNAELNCNQGMGHRGEGGRKYRTWNLPVDSGFRDSIFTGGVQPSRLSASTNLAIT